MSRDRNQELIPMLKWLPAEDDYTTFIPHWQEQFEMVLSERV
jgi:hypothetical protein